MFGSTNTKLWSGGTQYGYIMTQYPEGSQCQITRELDSTVLKARGNGSNWAFALPEMISLKVPAEYQEIEYIEATGTQCITLTFTNAVDVMALRYVMDIYVPSSAAQGGILGSTNSQPYFMIPLKNSNDLYPICTSIGGTQSPANNSLFNKRFTYELIGNGNSITVKADGNIWLENSSRGTSSRTQLGIFFDASGNRNYTSGRLYHLTIYDIDHTTKIFDLYSVYRKTDSVIGLYDAVNDTFYTNQGTGTFVAGPAVGDKWMAYCTDGENEAERKVNILYNGDIKSTELYYRVPKEYQAVEYIQSTGTQRIAIPLETAKNVNALKMIADIAIMEQGSETGATIMGHVDTTPYWKFIDFRNATTIYPTCTTNGAVDGTPDPSLLNTRAELTFEGSNNTVNIYKADTLWYSGTRNARNISIISLLALYRGTGYTYICMAAKLYKLEIYDTDHTTLLKNCYPCYRKSDNVAGLWDEANKVFYTNAGTGTFVIGPDI